MANLPHTPSSTRQRRPSAHFTPDTEAQSHRRPSATHHAYSGPASPVPDIPGAYPDQQQHRDPPLSPAFRSSGSNPTRSDSEQGFLGSAIDDKPGQKNPSTVEAALAAVRPKGVGPTSASPSPMETLSNKQRPHGTRNDDDGGSDNWCEYLKCNNPMGVASDHPRPAQPSDRPHPAPRSQQTAEPHEASQQTEPPRSGSHRSGRRSASLDEPAFVSDLARDSGSKTDVLSSMTSPQGHEGAARRGSDPQASHSQSSYSAQPSHSQSYSAHPINIIEGAESIASDIYHGAGHVLQQVEQQAGHVFQEVEQQAGHVFQEVEQQAGKYMHIPEFPKLGDTSIPQGLHQAEETAEHMFHQAEETAEHMFHHAEETAKHYMPSLHVPFTGTKSDARSTLAHIDDDEGRRSHIDDEGQRFHIEDEGQRSHIDEQGPHKEDRAVKAQGPDSSALPHTVRAHYTSEPKYDLDAEEHTVREHYAADENTVRAHYVNAAEEYDLDGEKLNTNQFVFEDDESAEYELSDAGVYRSERPTTTRPDNTTAKVGDQSNQRALEQPQHEHPLNRDIPALNEQPQREHPRHTPATIERKRRDRLSDAARHAYSPSDGTKPPARGFGEGDVAVGYGEGDEGDVAVGHGGVSFYSSGIEGIESIEGSVDRGGVKGSADSEGVLPGYPTPAGMSKLISDRMRDDRARARDVGRGMTTATILDTDPTGRHVTVSPDSRIVQEMLNETKHPRSRFFQGQNRSDVFVPLDVYMTTEVHSDLSPGVTNRKLEELRQSPIFVDGQNAAEGKFEAVFNDIDVDVDVADGKPAPAFSGVDPLDAPLRGRTIIERSQIPVFRHGDTATGQFDVPAFKESARLSTEKRQNPPEKRQKPTPNTSQRPEDTAAYVNPIKITTPQQSTIDPTRNPHEKSSIPIFTGRASTAAGKYEATYNDVSARPTEAPAHTEFAASKHDTTNSSNQHLGILGPSIQNPSQAEVHREVAAPLHMKQEEGISEPSTFSTERRQPLEKREIPIFKGGADTAAGQYEAGFMDVTGEPQDVPESPVFIRSSASESAETASGKYEARMEPNLSMLQGGGEVKGKGTESNTSDKPHEYRPVEYLGKPLGPVPEKATPEVYRRNEPLRKDIN